MDFLVRVELMYILFVAKYTCCLLFVVASYVYKKGVIILAKQKETKQRIQSKGLLKWILIPRQRFGYYEVKSTVPYEIFCLLSFWVAVSLNKS